MASSTLLINAVLIGALSCASTKKEVSRTGEMPHSDWPVLATLPRLDTTKVVTLPGSNAKVYRTEVMVAFNSGVSYESKQALFTTRRLRVLGRTPSGTFYVRFADRGPSFHALDAFMDSLRAQPGVETVAPINFTPLTEEG